MSIFSCWWWWLLLGGLIGWLASWWLTRGAARNAWRAWTGERVALTSQHAAELGARDATVARLQGDFDALKATPPKIVGRVVEKPVDRLVDKVVEKPVERIVERMVDNPAHLNRIRELEDQLRLWRVKVDRSAAKAAGFDVRGMDDLTVVEGIGPNTAGLLNDAGVFNFHELAAMKPPEIRAVLDRAGPNFAPAKPDSWPEQASLAANNKWAELRKLQDELTAGNHK